MYALITVSLLILLSTIYHSIMLKVEERKYLPPGKLIEIDGHRMHITRRGEGKPTIVMTCGSGAPSAFTEYCLIEPKLSKITRTSLYERPGYGWSEKASTPRNTEQIVKDLHRLLREAGETPPYLFVAHSLGAMEALLFTHQYPNEVEGIVLIDGTSPYKHIHHSESSIPIVVLYLIRLLNRLGIIRILVELKMIPLLNKRLNSMPKEIRAIDKAMIYKNISNRMIIKEGDSVKQVAEKMQQEINLHDKPLILFAADHSLKILPGWDKSQKSLSKLSKNSKMITINNANHISMLLEHSDIIVKSIQDLVIKTRKADII